MVPVPFCPVSRRPSARERHFGATAARVPHTMPPVYDNRCVSETPELLVADAARWRAWLSANHATSSGVRLVLAKKGVSEPTRLIYDDALPEALSYGWIDGHLTRRDKATYRVRFTPRRSRSSWSQRNVGMAEQLIAAGRMQRAGLAEVERAKADGRWERAYGGSASIEVPDDLRDALAASPRAPGDVGRADAHKQVCRAVPGARRQAPRDSCSPDSAVRRDAFAR